MNVHLLGAGSAGCLLAYHLQRSLDQLGNDEQVVLQLRTPSDVRPVQITIYDGEERLVGRREFASESAGQSDSAPIDVLVVTTKADQTIEAIRPLIPRFTQLQRRGPATLVLTQNGMGLDDEICKAFGWTGSTTSPYLVLGINRQGTWTKQRFETVHAGKGNFPFAFTLSTEERLGKQQAAAELIESSQDNSKAAPPDRKWETLARTIGMLCSPTMTSSLGTSFERRASDLSVQQQQKLVANCAINPLAALHTIRNREWATRPDVRMVGEKIIEECARVIAARWQLQNAGRDAPLPAALTHEALRAYVFDIVRVMSANWSSMVQDMWTKRGSTEVDFLNGTMVRWAEQAGISAPCNAEMVSLVQAKAADEAGRGKTCIRMQR